MADWNVPTNSSLYSDTLGLISARLVDAASLAESPTNPPDTYMRWNRSTLLLEEWASAAWNVRLLSIAGGGTGASTASGARTALGLGSIATQAASAVAITGGTIAGTTISSTNSIAASAINSGTLPEARISTTLTQSYTLSGKLTLTGDGISALTISTTNPVLNFYDTDGTLDTKYTRILCTSSGFSIQTINDAYGAILGTIFSLTRAGVLTVVGSGITALNATNLSSGTVATARLGSGTADSSTFLRGDGTWATPGGGGSGVPSGLIAIFDTSCPSGWTRVSAFDNKFLRGASSYGTTGGSDTHSHTISGSTASDGSHQHGINLTTGGPSNASLSGPDNNSFLAALNTHTHSVSGTSDSGGDHTHGVGSLGISSESNVPAYITAVFCKKD